MTVAPQSYAVRWRDLIRWDIKTARATAFRRAHPHFRRLADFAEEATVTVGPVAEPDHRWPVYGVNNTSGIFLSHHQKGCDFNSVYKRIQKDWFFHNPTRANVGSLGRVPAVPEDAITSPEYQVWRLTGSLTPAFVEILIRTRYFLDMIDCHRVGAVKQRLFVANLLEIPVPDVPLPDQRAIVAAFERGMKRAAKLRAEADALDAAAEADFLKALGLTPPAETTPPKAFAVWWSELQPRWGVDVNQRALATPDPSVGKYPVASLGDVIADLANGLSPKCHERPAVGSEWGVLKLGAVSFGEFNPDENKALPPKMKAPQSLEIRPGDWLVSRANVTRLVGACALVRETPPRLMLCDKIFRASWRDPSPVDPEYLDIVMKIPHTRFQIESNVTGTSATMKNITKPALLSLRLPCPPIRVQRTLVFKHRATRLKADVLRRQATIDDLAARDEVEAMILGSQAPAS